MASNSSRSIVASSPSVHAPRVYQLVPFVVPASSCACAAAVDNNYLRSIVPSRPPAQAPHVYYLVPVLLVAPPPHQTGHCSQPDVSVEADKSETFVRIQKDLIRLLDEEDKAPGEFKICNQKLRRRELVKLRRSELVWSRVVKKLLALFLLRNDPHLKFVSAAIGV